MSAACCVVNIAPVGTSVTVWPDATPPRRSMTRSAIAGARRTASAVFAMNGEDAVPGPRICKCRYRLRCARDLVLRRKTVSQVHRVGSVAHPDPPLLAMSKGLDSGTRACHQV